MEIVIGDKSLSENKAEQIRSIIVNEVSRFGLKLDKLGKLILAEDYEEEVVLEIRFIEGKDNDTYREYAKRSMAIKIGEETLNKDVELTVIVRKEGWKGIASGNKDYEKYCIHVINHEFVHVHDHDMKYYRMFSPEKMSGGKSLEYVLRYESDAAWSEYIAERMSSHTATIVSIDRAIDNMEIRVNRLMNISDEEALNYDRFSNYVTEILISLSMLMGICHGQGKDSNKSIAVDELVREIIEDERLLKAWDSIGVELSNLFDKYPNWNDVEELDGLAKVIENTWKEFGLL
ncbi:hypothetical protein ABEY63_00975 [Priestia aryabhattai]|uniref:hypothetical protein n=1 Tax=Priestia aryabhattai TaxID=412384 RepID=UPI002E20C0DA|nr:hypothetical protein [Priestia aryabhattai]MED4259723.1 hypothetical protein [Priestia aryabhattai]